MDLFDSISRIAVDALAAKPAVTESVIATSTDEMLADPDAHHLRIIATSRQDPRIEYVVMKAPWRPVCWGALGWPGATTKLERACRYEFGELPPLDATPGTFDTPAWRRSGDALFVGVAPSDLLDATPKQYLQPLTTFVRVVERRLRLGIPTSKRSVGSSIALVVTPGSRCPRCTKAMAPMAVKCADCGWTLSPGDTGGVEPLYPESLSDT